MKKFFGVIGNPPYQDDVDDNGRDNPIYPDFMDESYEVSDRVELITPARFLFNAGQTKKAWNRKMLADEHLKVLEYNADASSFFPGTQITGGIAITYHDKTKDFVPIEVFSPHPELNDIDKKVGATESTSLTSVITPGVPYRFTDVLRRERPDIASRIPESFDVRSNAFDDYSEELFLEEPPSKDGYVALLGNKNGKRVYRWIKESYIEGPSNFPKYKVLLSESNGGAGNIGDEPVRIIGDSIIGQPYTGHTQTFISIGAFETEEEAKALAKYLKTRFSRVMLGILKRTQHNPRATWAHVPLQDFTSSSDIDWSQSVADIDVQLYKKYGLSDEEIGFIETHVKEMD